MQLMQSTKFYENMRPRFNNLTYNSNNVGASLGFIYDPNYATISSSQNNKGLHKRHNSQSKLSNYGTQSLGALGPQARSGGLGPQVGQGSPNIYGQQQKKYGIRSLRALPQISDRDIYAKQEKKYNIISIQPIQHTQTIRKYPKFHLQHQDVNFYKKIQLENQYAEKRTNQKLNTNQGDNPETNQKQDTNGIRQYIQDQQQRNNLKNQPIKSFRGKMLNNIDELVL